MPSDAEAAIRRVIAERGPVTFAGFMELALYGEGGYYASGSPVSAGGDYFTSPAAHPLFGTCIAVQLREMWQSLGSPAEFTVVEEGAGNGSLAADVTEYAAALDEQFAAALRYVALDIAPPERQHYPVKPLDESPEGITGCVLSNELLDAMPVHRFEVRNGEAHEIFVGLEGDHLVEVLRPPSTPLIEQRLHPFLADLPDGYRGEVNPGLGEWARRQSRTVERGWVLTIDYGFGRKTLYRPERSSGSLRCYYQHVLGQDPLQRPGRQDMTAHVDFTAVGEAMADAGFDKAGCATQAEFLRRIGIGSAIERISAAALPRGLKRTSQAGAAALIDPEGMGRFTVTAHSRNVPRATLSGFGPDSQAPLHDFPSPPLLNPERHIDLTGSRRSPGGYFEVESLDELFRE